MGRMIKDESGIWHWGSASFLLHDNGWFFAWKQIIKCEATWPTHYTFKQDA